MPLLSYFYRRFVKLTDPADWPTSSSYTGKTITPEGAMQLSTWWSCVRLISETVATLPIGVFSRLPDGSKLAQPKHYLYPLLHDSPNADQTAAEFWEGQIASLCIFGNGYSEKEMSGKQVVALTPLPADPEAMSVTRDRFGALQYRYNDRNGKQVTLPEEKVFHIRGFGVGGDVGMSPVSYARQTLSIADAIGEAAGKNFKMGMRSSGFFEGPPGTKFTPAQRDEFKKNFIDPYLGLEATAKVGLLENGFKFNPVTISAQDAEMLLSWRFSVEEICRWLRVPPILIGHAGEGQTMWGSGVEQIMIGWLTLGLRPYLTRVEQAIKKRLLPPEDRSGVFAEFNVEGLLRADSAGRAEMYSKMVQVGAVTPNQICDRENFPRFEGGDVHLVNSTLVPLDQAGRKPGRVQPAPGEPIPE